MATEEPVAILGPPHETSNAFHVGRGDARKQVSFFREGKTNEADFASTRRMPSDAKWALWQQELETL